MKTTYLQRMFTKSRPTAISVMLAIVVTLAYWRVFENGFITYDDPDYITGNRQVLAGLTLEGILWAFSSFDAGNWHPLTWVGHMVTVELFGLNPAAHHGASLLLHCANTILVFLVLRRLTGATLRSAVVALLFGLHPLHVESVAWAAELKDVLCAFFFLLTIRAYAWYADSPGIRRYLPVTILYVLALLSKPMAVTLPAVLLLIDYWPLGRFSSLSAADSGRENSPTRLILEKLPLLLLAAASSWVTWLAQDTSGMVNHPDGGGFLLQSGNAAIVYVAYLAKMLWPAHLSIQYPFDPSTITFPRVALSALLLLGITCMVFYRSGRPWLRFGWMWYLGTLVPVIGLVRIGSHSMADRYTYLPLIGVFIMLVWGSSALLERIPAVRRILAAASIPIMIALAVATSAQVATWRDSSTLYRHALDLNSTSWPIHNNLAVILIKQGDAAGAYHHLQESLRFNPDFAEARYNLGLLYLNKFNDNGKAIENFLEAVRIRPGYADAHFYLGKAYIQSRQWRSAESEYQTLLKLDGRLAGMLKELTAGDPAAFHAIFGNENGK